MSERELLSGLVRLHLLHHAAHEPIFGLGMIEELKRHGYALGAGTMYPILHGLERAGYIRSRIELVGPRRRRLYFITKSGREALAFGKTKVWELFRELFEDELHFSTTPHMKDRGAVSIKKRKKNEQPGRSRSGASRKVGIPRKKN